MKQKMVVVLIAFYSLGAAFSWGVWSGQDWPKPRYYQECTTKGKCWQERDGSEQFAGQAFGSFIWPFVWTARLGVTVGR